MVAKGWIAAELPDDVQSLRFDVLPGELEIDLRVLVNRSLVETFVHFGRVVLATNYISGVPYMYPPAAAAAVAAAVADSGDHVVLLKEAEVAAHGRGNGHRNTTVHEVALGGGDVVLSQARVYSMGCMWKTDDE